MSTEILINVTATETRAAVISVGVVQEIAIERASQRSLVGNIYKARVERVLPGLQAAFVDIGLPQMAFLQMTDVPAGVNAVTQAQLPYPSLQQGQVLLVQVIKDPHDTKGARLSTCLSLAGRYVVWVPQGQGVAISHRIADAERRAQLQQRLSAMVGSTGGWIVRTAAGEVAEPQLQQQITKLQTLWQQLQNQAIKAAVGTLLWQEWPLAVRILRDRRDFPLPLVKIDCALTVAEIRQWVQQWMPEWEEQIQPYTAARPIFDLYNTESTLQQALSRKVNLPSGGQLIIDETEAMTTIDVNTAAFIGQDFAATVLQTNLEAATAIATQLRLRRIGGMIIIDFIDMKFIKDRNAVLNVLTTALAQDPIKTQVSDVSNLGLVSLTRKRTEKSLRQLLYTDCPACTGCGQLKSVETVAFEVIRALRWQAQTQAGNTLTVLASTAVADYLLNNAAEIMHTMSKQINKQIMIEAQPTYGQDKYKLV